MKTEYHENHVQTGVLQPGSTVCGINQGHFTAELLERLEAWEKNPDRPCEIELYHDWAPYSFGFTQRYRTAAEGLSEGCSITVHRMNRLPYS